MNIEDIKVKYITFNIDKMIVKVKVLNGYNIVQFAIGLSVPSENNYENFFTKVANVIDGEVIFKEKLIENPPYNFYKRYLLKDGKLSYFYEKLEEELIKAKKDDNSLIKTFYKREVEGKKDYFLTFKKLKGKNKSNKMRSKVKYMLGTDVLEFCDINELTAVFTSNSQRAKIEKVHNIIKYNNRKQ